VSPLSDKSFIIIIVELKAIAIEMYAAVSVEKPRARVIRKPKPKVNMICPSPATSETLPTSLITFGFRFSPTMNSRTAIPISANAPMLSVEPTRFRKYGLTKIPVRM